jgi:hypothetical protein
MLRPLKRFIRRQSIIHKSKTIPRTYFNKRGEIFTVHTEPRGKEAYIRKVDVTIKSNNKPVTNAYFETHVNNRVVKIAQVGNLIFEEKRTKTPSFKTKQSGRELFRAILDTAITQGQTHLGDGPFSIKISPANDLVKKYYESFGFKPTRTEWMELVVPSKSK